MLRAVVPMLALSACSFVFVHGPPPPPPKCTTSTTAPIIDTAVTVLAAVAAIYFATSDDDKAAIGVLVEGTIAVGFATSAIVGYRRVGRCAQATP